MSKLIIYGGYLRGRNLRTARYLAALSNYRRLAAMVAEEVESGRADMTAVDAAAARLAEIEDDPEFVRDRMVSVSEAARVTGLSTALIRRLANGNHPLSDQVRSEQRHGKLWYVYPGDIWYLLDTEEIVPRSSR